MLKNIKPQAKIAFVLDHPLSRDIVSGCFFSSTSAAYIKNCFRQQGLNFESFEHHTLIDSYVRNWSRYYIDKKKSEPTGEYKKYQAELKEDLKRSSANVIVCVGQEALKTLTGKKSVDKYRGMVYYSEELDKKIIPLYHPSVIMKMFKLMAITKLDCLKIVRECVQKEPICENYLVEVNKSFTYVMQRLTQIRDEVTRVAFDLETLTDDFIIRCFSFAYRLNGVPIGISIPLVQKPTTVSKTLVLANKWVNSWTPQQEVQILNLVREILVDEKIQKIGQNSISFDQPKIEALCQCTIKNHYLDTLHAFHCLQPEMPKSLDFLTSIYTDFPNYFSEKVTANDISEWTYNAYDSLATLISAEGIERDFIEYGQIFGVDLQKLYFGHVHRLALALSQAEQRGVLFDVVKQQELKKQYGKLLEDLLRKIQEIAGYEINPNSPKQLCEYFYEKLNYKTILAKQTKNPTTDENALKNLRKLYPEDKMLPLLMEYRKKSKIHGTYLSCKIDPDNRMRCSYNASGTKTGRISSSSTLSGTGTNLQNQPQIMRPLYIAGAGRKIVKADLEQAEAWVVAVLLWTRGGDRTLLTLMEQDTFDIHKWAAAGVFGVDESEITKAQRAIGKLQNHSGNYGAGPGVLVAQSVKRDVYFNGVLGIDFNFAKEVLSARHKKLPALRLWWKWVEQKVQRDQSISTCWGRLRIFNDRVDQTMFKSAYAQEPQSTIGDLTNYIFYKIHETFRERNLDAHTVLQVHDEVNSDVREDLVPEVIKIYQEVADYTMVIDGYELKVPLEIKVGDSWGDLVLADEYLKNI